MPRMLPSMTPILVALLAGLATIAVAGDAPPRPTISDEAQVPPYTLPDPLVCIDGTRVADAAMWRERRRPELLQLFADEVYGRTLLGRPAAMRCVVREEIRNARNDTAIRLRIGVLFEGREDGRQVELLVYLPKQASGPVPVFLGLSFDGNYTVSDDADLPVAKHWAMGLYANRLKDHVPTAAGRGIHKDMWQVDQVLARGYGLVTAGYGEVEPDAPGRWKEGPRGLAAEPGERDWASVGAWAWAMSRAMDWVATEPRIDATRVTAIGFSRLGKTAMWAGAQDERFAAVVSIESGAGGVALSKRIFGETVAHMMRSLGHWFCPAYRRYADNEAALPIDQHELAALIAPRPLLILSAVEDRWSDPKGEFLGGLGADPVYRLLGTDGCAVKEWPAVGTLVDSRIGYHLRPGRHDVNAVDWQAMLAFADKHLKR